MSNKGRRLNHFCNVYIRLQNFACLIQLNVLTVNFDNFYIGIYLILSHDNIAQHYDKSVMKFS